MVLNDVVRDDGGSGIETAYTAAATGRGRGWRQVPWVPIISSIAGLLIWQLVADEWNFIYLPPVTQVMRQLVHLVADGTILQQLGSSLEALAIGGSIAIVAGIVLGTLMGLVPIIREAFRMYVDMLMTAPMVAFVPLFILVFGLGFETQLIVVGLYTFFPVVVNTEAGMRAADQNLLTMASSFGYRRVRTFWHVRLPMSYDYLQAGLRLGVARGVDGVIIGEVLIAAGGLGGLVTRFGQAFSYDELYAVVIVIVLLAVLSRRFVTFITAVLLHQRGLGREN